MDEAAELALLAYYGRPVRGERCRCCGRTRPVKNRGLCCRCYFTPGLREKYPPTSRHARRGVGLGRRAGRRLPDAPTAAAPGSPEKVAVLEERARQGVALWHPGDAPMDPESRKLGMA